MYMFMCMARLETTYYILNQRLDFKEENSIQGIEMNRGFLNSRP